MHVSVINEAYHCGKISVTYIDVTQFLIKLVGYFPYFMNQSIKLGTSWYSMCHEFCRISAMLNQQTKYLLV